MLLALCTELLANGGIQRMSRHFGAAFRRLTARRGEELRLLSLNDPRGTHSLNVGGEEFRFTGFGREKFRFFASATAHMRRADLVFVGHPHLASLSLAAGLRPGTRVWTQAYGVEVWSPLPAISRWALQRADLVTGISAHTNEMLRTVQGVGPGRIGLLPPALDPSQEPGPGVEARRDGPLLRVLTVSRLDVLDPYKGIEQVLAAVDSLKDRFPTLRYTIVGEGSDRARLEGLAANMGLGERVEFLGSVDDATLRNVYAGSDLFILPSMREGFGIVYLEAMAHGVPVVGIDCAGTRDVIRDGFNGAMLAGEDRQAMVERLSALLRDAALRRRLGENGREFAKTFSLETFYSRVAAFVEQEATCASSM